MFGILAAVFFCVVCLMPFVWNYAWRIGALDIPKDWRRMHRKTVPRNGGMAITGAFLLGCAMLGVRDTFFGYALGCGSLIFWVGLIDDIRNLPPRIKFLVQMLCALAVSYKGMQCRGIVLVGAFFWILLLTNAHNFIDGLDGLFCGCTAMEAFAVGLLLLGMGLEVRAMAVFALSAALLAFRIFNRHPAMIFAGDCGSCSVGFLLGVFSWDLFQAQGAVGERLLPILIFAYPLTDLFAAVMRRVLRGKSPFYADRGHLHHRICDAGVSTVQCVRILLTLTFCFCGLSVLIGVWSLYEVASIACVATAALLILIRRKILRMA